MSEINPFVEEETLNYYQIYEELDKLHVRRVHLLHLLYEINYGIENENTIDR